MDISSPMDAWCTERLPALLVSPHHESADALCRHGRESPVLVPANLLVFFEDVLLDHLLHACHMHRLGALTS